MDENPCAAPCVPAERCGNSMGVSRRTGSLLRRPDRSVGGRSQLRPPPDGLGAYGLCLRRAFDGGDYGRAQRARTGPRSRPGRRIGLAAARTHARGARNRPSGQPTRQLRDGGVGRLVPPHRSSSKHESQDRPVIPALSSQRDNCLLPGTAALQEPSGATHRAGRSSPPVRGDRARRALRTSCLDLGSVRGMKQAISTPSEGRTSPKSSPPPRTSGRSVVPPARSAGAVERWENKNRPVPVWGGRVRRGKSKG